MRNVNYTNALNSTREISARATVRDVRLRFKRFLASETLAVSYDSDKMEDGNILAVKTVENGANDALYFCIIEFGADDFRSPTWVNASLSVKKNSRIGVYENRIFFQGGDGVLYYIDYSSGLGSAVSFSSDFTSVVCAIAPVNTTEIYVLGVSNTSNYDYLDLVYIDISGGTTKTRDGKLYEDGDEIPYMDAVRHSGADTIYFTEAENNRTVYIKRTGDWWSEQKNVIPLDIVDDQSSFRMHSVSEVNGNILLVGTLKRTYGTDMLIYSFGPEEFSLGRDMFISSYDTASIGCKFFLNDDVLWNIGPGVRHAASATYLIGIDNEVLKLQTSAIVNASMQCPINNANTLSFTIPNSTDRHYFVPGSEVEFEVKVGDEYSSIGTFVIEQINLSEENSGKDFVVNARSKGIKKLIQWESDAAYDYWSQTKVSNDPSDLTEFVRSAGKWNTDDVLYQEDYCTDGMMYLVEKSARNGEISAKITPKTADNYARFKFGVGLGYYLESKYAAAERLGIDEDDVLETDYGHNGLVAGYCSGDIVTGYSERFFIGIMDNSVLTELFTAYTPNLIEEETYWIMLKLYEGQAFLYFRLDGSDTWTMALRETIANEEQTLIPWKQNEEGRGFIYSINQVPHSTSYEFANNADYIPLDDNSDFPASDTVLIDSEKITYASKTENRSISGLELCYGRLVTATVNDVSPTGWQVVGQDRSATFLKYVMGVDMVRYIKAVRLFIKKVGSPSDGFTICAQSDNSTYPWDPNKMISEKVTVSSEEISSDGSWVTFVFENPIKCERDYEIIMTRGSSQVRPDLIEGTNNYYAVTATGNEITGSLFYWDEDYDTFNEVSSGGDCLIECYGDTFVLENASALTVSYNAGLSSVDDYYNDCCLVATSGKGEGVVTKIEKYDYKTTAARPYIYIDKDPNLFDDTTVFKIVPALTGLTRGVGDTIAVAHSETDVNLYRALPFCEIHHLNFASSDEDKSVCDAANIISRKAGLEAEGDLAFSSSVIPCECSETIKRKNVILDIELSEIPYGNIQLEFLKDGDGNRIVLEIGNSYLKLYGNDTLRETFSPGINFIGTVRVSFFDGTASVWCNGCFVHTFFVVEDDEEIDGDTFAITGTSSQTVGIVLYQACMRVDNFIMDNYRKGFELIRELIGEKRLFVQDTVDGKLRIYEAKTEVNSFGSPYELSCSASNVYSDVGLITRVLLEGAEVHERFDEEAMIEHGNIFHGQNMSEINSLYDAQHFTEKAIEDYGVVYAQKAFMGAADPRIEQNDIIYTLLPRGVSKVIVNNITFTLSINDGGAIFDMRIDGSVPMDWQSIYETASYLIDENFNLIVDEDGTIISSM